MKKQNDQMGKLTDGLMVQAAMLNVFGKPANNYMVAIALEGEEQINIVPMVGCEDGCTMAIKLAIEHLQKFGHKGIATDVLVCGCKFWFRPSSEFVRQMQGERPIFVQNARDGFGKGLGEKVMKPIGKGM